MKKLICLISVLSVGFSFLICSPGVIRGEESDQEAKSASGDFNFARETYDELLGKIHYDSSSLEKQLTFNKKREKEIQAELRAKKRFLSSLPRTMGKFLSRVKRTSAGENEELLETAAGEFKVNYDALCRETIEEIEALKKDLLAVRLRIAALEPQIELTGIKKELHLTSSAGLTETDDKSQDSAVAYLEEMTAEAMQEEIGELGNLELASITDDDTYREDFLEVSGF